LLNYFLYLIIFQPGVYDLDLLTQNRKHHHLGKALPVAINGILFVIEVNNFPIQAMKLVDQRFFDMVAFVEFDVRRCFVLDHMFSFPFVYRFIFSDLAYEESDLIFAEGESHFF